MKDQLLLAPALDFTHIILGKQGDGISTARPQCEVSDVRHFHGEDA